MEGRVEGGLRGGKAGQQLHLQKGRRKATSCGPKATQAGLLPQRVWLWAFYTGPGRSPAAPWPLPFFLFVFIYLLPFMEFPFHLIPIAYVVPTIPAAVQLSVQPLCLSVTRKIKTASGRT